MTTLRVVLSGCSGGGKSTLLGELAARGYAVFEEPGRGIVKEQLASGGDALPWLDAEKFLHACVKHALVQWEAAARADGPCFFDRSLLDAFNGFATLGVALDDDLSEILHTRRYDRRVFLAPPWPEIYVTDDERRHSFADAVAEFDRLQTFVAQQGYETVLLPKVSAAERSDFVLRQIDAES